MFFEQYSHEPAIAVNRYLLHFAGVPPDEARLAENHARGLKALEAMESQLSGAAWFTAGRYGVADIALYAYTHLADEAGFSLQGFPAVRAWLACVAARPGHVALMEETSAEPVERLVKEAS